MTPREQAAALAQGCERVETPAELAARLEAKWRLTVKLGIDPTGSYLHLGHAVVLHKLQEFVTFGHRVILLIGDFTARIGDPTGRNDTRPPLDDEAIAQNMRDYREQAGTVLDLERVEVMYNSTWLAPLSLDALIGLLAQTTVAQMLARNDFAERYAGGVPIALHEFLYPIAQAYDSVAMQADVELGGSDQLFNLLLGREYQHHAGQPKQICITTPILEGTDGAVRMGKSRGNFIGLTEAPNEQFGKLMRIPDELVPRYALLAAFRSAQSVAALEAQLAAGSLHPMDAKKDVAQEIVARYHGARAARLARDGFEATVQRGEEPSDMPEIESPGSWRTVADALVGCGFATSKREAERLVAGRGVKVDGLLVEDARRAWAEAASTVLSVGSRRFVRILRRSRASSAG
ncbi:MAG: tyrosine--tRNA ligase [Candidatus Eremiobacteraeota bacterium]|nr:tyrosine--tRNA ligase [Candidatus Eremiobacteraeota bacterium]MBC5802335.1 tyrosine--tRNA ligase [Candidatus Eremiobacteraeota bacterium]MBC5822716.1 tyrosine--tRNA ligase [Candidatus Eremiobacteraeota bacterium]